MSGCVTAVSVAAALCLVAEAVGAVLSCDDSVDGLVVLHHNNIGGVRGIFVSRDHGNDWCCHLPDFLTRSAQNIIIYIWVAPHLLYVSSE